MPFSPSCSIKVNNILFCFVYMIYLVFYMSVNKEFWDRLQITVSIVVSSPHVEFQGSYTTRSPESTSLSFSLEEGQNRERKQWSFSPSGCLVTLTYELGERAIALWQWRTFTCAPHTFPMSKTFQTNFYYHLFLRTLNHCRDGWAHFQALFHAFIFC